MRYILSFSLSLLTSVVAATRLEASREALDIWMQNMTRQKACYSDLGCFDLSHPWFSWSRPVPALPQPPEVIETKFYLLTRDNLPMPQLLRTRPVIDLSGSLFKKSQKLYYIVHGYVGHYNDEWAIILAHELLRRVWDGKGAPHTGIGRMKSCGKCGSRYLDGNGCGLAANDPQETRETRTYFDSNVILVDWSNGANMLNYIQAVANARLVGTEMARLTTALTQLQLSHPSKIHALGYSLGAQVISYMANNITGLHRITALDPAQPGFESTDPVVHLEQSDAQFVDVLHTNGVPFIPGFGLGMRESVGHVDFLLNGGETQPGCRQYVWKSASQFDKKDVYESVVHYLENHHTLNIRVDNLEELQDILLDLQIQEEIHESVTSTSLNLLDFLTGTLANLVEYVICSHEKAPKYLIESLQHQDCSFWGVPWEPFQYPPPPGNCTYHRCTEMGIYSILYPARGNFYVATNENAPFCRKYREINALMKNAIADHFLQFENKC